MKKLLLVILLLAAPAMAAPAPLIVISIDGFRADFLDRGITPTLSLLARTGVRATMRPSFPTLTYPNHYTLVTGLVPDHHGIVDNEMWDAAIGQRFTMGAATAWDPRWWEGAKPIWVTAAEQHRITAVASWPGSDTGNHGHMPNYLAPWRDKRTADEAARTVLNWMDLPHGLRPQITLAYFYEVDHQAHEHGPVSRETDAALAQVDQAVATLVTGLKARHLYDGTNIVIVADHGMTAMPPGQVTVLDELVPPTIGTVRAAGAGGGVDPLPGHDGEVAAILLTPHDHFTCWRKADIPPALHYGANPRVPAFYCLNQPGWRFIRAADKAKRQNPGAHGFAPDLPDMQALFLAHGPAFRSGVRLPAIANVDVYPMLATITGLTPEKNDGDAAALAPALSP